MKSKRTASKSSVPATPAPVSDSAQALPETLRGHLRTLGLAYMEAHGCELAQEAARCGTGHLAYLELLAAGEAACQHDRAVARRLAAARFPVTKTIAGWNWSWPKKINRMQVEHLFELGFLQSCANVVLLGPTGVGKTHLACALGHAACLKRHRVLYAAAIDIVNRLSAAQSSHQLAAELKRYQTPRILIVDELGYLPLDKRGGQLLFQVLTKRYEAGSTILTTNIAYKDWPSIFAGDATMTSALLDRLLHRCETVVIEADSYRSAKNH